MIKNKPSPAEFVRQVRLELAKISWPTPKETGTATLMVFVMVAFMSIFFLLTDQLIAWTIGKIIGY